ncbi:hypothetical protein [Salinicola sp. DM10]|uniref:hypothetical protein n=1 Tax=Salinicola sp. DM10 TaxID=2815721 RepID=UPI001A8BF566|nr:hypothetical protein [Salinicola sp. DM10]MCE3025745.1 hypothetical protein [Salinicola sp. DM10]
MGCELSKFVLNGEDLTAEANDFARHLGLEEVAPGRIARYFLAELYIHTFLTETIDPRRVVKEIASLEGKGLTQTKPAAAFKGPVLKGLWHKHHQQIGVPALAMNVLNEGRQDKWKHIEKHLQSLEGLAITDTQAWDLAGALSEEVVRGGLNRRIERQALTGEWFIFTKYEELNYYLCLGKHEDDDEELRLRAINSINNHFPFLRHLLS